MEKATDKVKVTAKDGGETSPTRTKVGGEAMARKAKKTQKNDTTEKRPKKRANSSGNNKFATIVRSRDTSAESVERGLQTKPRKTPQ
jgi:hypothetical protein